MTEDAATGTIPTTTAERIQDLHRRRSEALHAGSTRSVEKQHAKGKLTARERIDILLDPGSFRELDEFARHRSTAFGMDSHRPYGDGVVTGYGTIDGRKVCVYAHDFTVFGGSLGEVFGEKVLKVQDLALKIGCPVIGLNDSGGARIQEGVVSLAYYAENGRRVIRSSGVIPQISLIMGPCAGGAVYSPAMTDFTVMVDQTSYMFVTGPDVVKAVTGDVTTAEELGGGLIQSTVAGNCHYLATDERDALEFTRELLSYLPQNNCDEPPTYLPDFENDVTDVDRALDTVIPDSPNMAYDMDEVVRSVLDGQEMLELQPGFGRSMITGFGRIEGNSVGIVANRPAVNAGSLDIDASEKAARFVRFCDCFGIPVVTFVDVPGYMPGTDQERAGIIRRGAKLLFAYGDATVPLVTVVTRKAYGGGYAVMGSKHFGADVNYAWPSAQIAVMGAQAAVGILYRQELTAAKEQGRFEDERAKRIEEYNETMASPYVAAERGWIDEVIAPQETRLRIAESLRMLKSKRAERPARKFGNIPL